MTMTEKPRKPKKVKCLFCDICEDTDTFICEADKEGWGRCGDELASCPWIDEVLEYQEIKHA